MNNNDFRPICMAKEFWASSQLSVAKYSGGCTIGGHEYLIVDSLGRDLFHVTIPPGAPADLVRKDFIKYYAKLGRDRFLQVLRLHPRADDKTLKQCLQATIESRKKSKTAKQLSLF